VTGDEFTALINRTGWSARSIAKRFRLSHGTIGDMTTGRIPVQPALAAYLERVASAIERIKLPDLPDRRGRWRD
jgi:hypothetical protein